MVSTFSANRLMTAPALASMACDHPGKQAMTGKQSRRDQQTKSAVNQAGSYDQAV
jgi:hypothetical protein